MINTFILSLKDMKRKNPQIDKVLHVIGYLSPDYLEAQLIEDFNKKPLKKEIQLLVDYSILTPSEQYYKIHPITQEAIQIIHKGSNIF